MGREFLINFDWVRSESWIGSNVNLTTVRSPSSILYTCCINEFLGFKNKHGQTQDLVFDVWTFFTLSVLENPVVKNIDNDRILKHTDSVSNNIHWWGKRSPWTCEALHGNPFLNATSCHKLKLSHLATRLCDVWPCETGNFTRLKKHWLSNHSLQTAWRCCALARRASVQL